MDIYMLQGCIVSKFRVSLPVIKFHCIHLQNILTWGQSWRTPHTLFYNKLTGESLMQDLLRRQPGTVPRKWVCVYYVQRRLIRGYLDKLLMDREQFLFIPSDIDTVEFLSMRDLPILTSIHFMTFFIVVRVLGFSLWFSCFSSIHSLNQ